MWQIGEEIMTGVCQRRLSNGFLHIRVHYTADPAKDDKWMRQHALNYGGLDTAGWRREQEIDYHAYGGQRIWPMLSKAHNAITDITGWTLFRVIDQGIRHPTVCLWVAVNAKGDRHIYREYYSTDRSISMNCRAILALTPNSEFIRYNWIDPSTKKRSAESLTPMIEVFEKNGLSCVCADNSFAGYDTVRDGLLSTLARRALYSGELPSSLKVLKPSQDQLLVLAAKPALTFDLRFTSNSFLECCNHRWQEIKGDESQKAPREKPMDKDDDGPDCVRYAMQSHLFYRPEKPSEVKIIDYRAILRVKGSRNPSKKESKYARRAYL